MIPQNRPEATPSPANKLIASFWNEEVHALSHILVLPEFASASTVRKNKKQNIDGVQNFIHNLFQIY